MKNNKVVDINTYKLQKQLNQTVKEKLDFTKLLQSSVDQFDSMEYDKVLDKLYVPVHYTGFNEKFF